jgi:sulfatase modifying factor 1
MSVCRPALYFLMLPGMVACGMAAPPRSAISRSTGASQAHPSAVTRPPATPTALATPPALPRAIAAPSPCPDDMIALPLVCIDRYEAPNAEGQMPLAMQTAKDGETWCAARGKRLCTEDEWVRACEGPDGLRYPYGNDYRESVCNDDHPWIAVNWALLAEWPNDVAVDEARRLYQAEKSGERVGCVSEEGVWDLTGNVAEWVRRSDTAPRAGYDHVLKGCYWAGCYHEAHPNCVFRNSAHPGAFRTYEAGFRCCRAR